MSDLRSDLQDIKGIGEAKSDAIMTVLDNHNTTSDVEEELRQAWDYYQEERYEYAGKYLRRAIREVDG